MQFGRRFPIKIHFSPICIGENTWFPIIIRRLETYVSGNSWFFGKAAAAVAYACLPSKVNSVFFLQDTDYNFTLIQSPLYSPV